MTVHTCPQGVVKGLYRSLPTQARSNRSLRREPSETGDFLGAQVGTPVGQALPAALSTWPELREPEAPWCAVREATWTAYGAEGPLSVGVHVFLHPAVFSGAPDLCSVLGGSGVRGSGTVCDLNETAEGAGRPGHPQLHRHTHRYFIANDDTGSERGGRGLHCHRTWGLALS